MNVAADRNAPVFASSETAIESSSDAVWDTLTGIEKWPDWQTSVTEVNVKAPIGEGTAFTWKADGIAFTSTVHTMKPKEMFGWTGKAIGAYAIHNWEFSERKGITIVKVEESLQGILPKLLKGYFQKNLEKGIQKNLKELKAASELKQKA